MSFKKIFIFVIEIYGISIEASFRKSYKVWWESFAGYFSIEKSIGEHVQLIYNNLANLLIVKGIKHYEEALEYFDGKLGLEARAILRNLINTKEKDADA